MFSKQQFRHISPAGVYQIKEFISLPPVSSKSAGKKPGEVSVTEKQTAQQI